MQGPVVAAGHDFGHIISFTEGEARAPPAPHIPELSAIILGHVHILSPLESSIASLDRLIVGAQDERDQRLLLEFPLADPLHESLHVLGSIGVSGMTVGEDVEEDRAAHVHAYLMSLDQVEDRDKVRPSGRRRLKHMRHTPPTLHVDNHGTVISIDEVDVARRAEAVVSLDDDLKRLSQLVPASQSTARVWIRQLAHRPRIITYNDRSIHI